MTLLPRHRSFQPASGCWTKADTWSAGRVEGATQSTFVPLYRGRTLAERHPNPTLLAAQDHTHGPPDSPEVAAVAGTNDGGRPTAFLADEVHERLGNKRRCTWCCRTAAPRGPGRWC